MCLSGRCKRPDFALAGSLQSGGVPWPVVESRTERVRPRYAAPIRAVQVGRVEFAAAAQA